MTLVLIIIGLINAVLSAINFWKENYYISITNFVIFVMDIIIAVHRG